MSEKRIFSKEPAKNFDVDVSMLVKGTDPLPGFMKSSNYIPDVSKYHGLEDSTRLLITKDDTEMGLKESKPFCEVFKTETILEDKPGQYLQVSTFKAPIKRPRVFHLSVFIKSYSLSQFKIFCGDTGTPLKEFHVKVNGKRCQSSMVDFDTGGCFFFQMTQHGHENTINVSKENILLQKAPLYVKERCIDTTVNDIEVVFPCRLLSSSLRIEYIEMTMRLQIPEQTILSPFPSSSPLLDTEMESREILHTRRGALAKTFFSVEPEHSHRHAIICEEKCVQYCPLWNKLILPRYFHASKIFVENPPSEFFLPNLINAAGLLKTEDTPVSYSKDGLLDFSKHRDVWEEHMISDGDVSFFKYTRYLPIELVFSKTFPPSEVRYPVTIIQKVPEIGIVQEQIRIRQSLREAADKQKLLSKQKQKSEPQLPLVEPE